MDVRVSGLFVYPVKSCRGFAVARSALDACGLAYDRRFMVVNDAGMFCTQRELPQMARIATAIAGDALRLSCEDTFIDVPLRPDSKSPIDVRLWRDRVQASHVDIEVDRWLRHHLGESVRLAYIPDEVVRPVDTKYAAGSRTGFADGYPLLVVGQASLDDLNARLSSPVPMSRFRPNVVVSGSAPFAEDDWQALRVGDLRLRIVKPCARCTIVGTDQVTGDRDAEPLRTLATYRKVGNEVVFGQNAVHDDLGVLAVGDPVIMERAA